MGQEEEEEDDEGANERRDEAGRAGGVLSVSLLLSGPWLRAATLKQDVHSLTYMSCVCTPVNRIRTQELTSPETVANITLPSPDSVVE